MTESLSDPRASQSFVIVSAKQMAALDQLLFMLVKYAHEHNAGTSAFTGPQLGVTRDDCNEMHRLREIWAPSAEAQGKK